MSTRKFAAIAAGMTLALGLTACGGGGAGDTPATDEPAGDAPADDPAAEPTEGGTIGVSMPTQTSERWIADGD
jgi:putative multiple sugar transport system substrate-binding protein